jgi:tetratricopeptide (TPR) repeat protein
MSLWQQGNKEQARIWYDGACVMMDEYGSDNAELLRFRPETAELLGLPKGPPLDQRPDKLKVAESIVAISPDDPTALRLRAIAYADREDWSRAAADFSRIVQVDEMSWYTGYERALSMLAAKDRAGYQKACTEMYNTFGQSTDKTIGTLIAWASSIGPQATVDYAPLLALAEAEVKANASNWGALKNLGAILFRSGRYEEAMSTLTDADQLAMKPSASATSSPIYLHLFLAMTHHHLGQTEQARKWLDISVAEIDKAFGDHANGTARMSWNRRTTLKLLKHEAESLITGNTAQQPPNAAAPTTEPAAAKP